MLLFSSMTGQWCHYVADAHTDDDSHGLLVWIFGSTNSHWFVWYFFVSPSSVLQSFASVFLWLIMSTSTSADCLAWFLFKVPYWVPKLCQASFRTITLFNSSPSTCPLTLCVFDSTVWFMGPYSKIKTKTQDVLTYICRFILVMVVDSSAKYEKRDNKRKGP